MKLTATAGLLACLLIFHPRTSAQYTLKEIVLFAKMPYSKVDKNLRANGWELDAKAQTDAGLIKVDYGKSVMVNGVFKHEYISVEIPKYGKTDSIWNVMFTYSNCSILSDGLLFLNSKGFDELNPALDGGVLSRYFRKEDVKIAILEYPPTVHVDFFRWTFVVFGH